MTKRVLLAFALCLMAAVAFADVEQKDVLLTSDGTLYSVETVRDATLSHGSASSYLVLTTQRGDARETAIVPGTTTAGAHGNPALGYDPDSKTLFLFWQQSLNGVMSSRLLFSSYQNQTWTEPTTLDAVDYDVRRNLKIAVTRYVQAGDAQGRQVLVTQTTVHAVWWQQSGSGESARYAMLTIETVR